MAAFGVILSVAACLLMSHRACARTEAPCQRSKWSNGFNTFVKRHVRAGTPATLDQNEWEKYIRNNGGCERPTQSFLRSDDLDQVKAVCSNAGGKVFKENLCISQRAFSFVTVRSEPGTCGIRSVRPESKHLILACELLDNQCLPVHFEGNPENLKPSNNARGCQEPQSRAHALSLRPSALCLLALLPLTFIF